MPEQHLQPIRSIAMTDAERRTLRHRLHAFAISNPAAASLSSRTWRWVLRHSAATLGLAVLLVAGGTSVSAERSRPGDLLYGFRLSVNDRVEHALAFSEDAQVDVEMSHLQRMIDEEEAVRDEELTDMAFEYVADTDENFEDEFERELRDIELELEAEAELNDMVSEESVDDGELRGPSRTPEVFDDGTLERELRNIERELYEEERARLELE